MTDFLHFVFPGLPVSKEKQLAREIIAELKGGEGSGNFGHAGRPGEVGGSAGGGGVIDRSELKKGARKSYTFRGISREQYNKFANGENLTSDSRNMLSQAGRKGELQTTDSLDQAEAHAMYQNNKKISGVVLVIPRKLTQSKSQFADIRKVKSDRLNFGDVIMAYDPDSGEILHKNKELS